MILDCRLWPLWIRKVGVWPLLHGWKTTLNSSKFNGLVQLWQDLFSAARSRFWFAKEFKPTKTLAQSHQIGRWPVFGIHSLPGKQTQPKNRSFWFGFKKRLLSEVYIYYWLYMIDIIYVLLMVIHYWYYLCNTYIYLYLSYTPFIPISFKTRIHEIRLFFWEMPSEMPVLTNQNWPLASCGEAKRASLAVNNSGAEAACAWCAAGKSKSANVRTLE